MYLTMSECSYAGCVENDSAADCWGGRAGQVIFGVTGKQQILPACFITWVYHEGKDKRGHEPRCGQQSTGGARLEG